MHTVFLSFSTCSPYLPPQPPFKFRVFQIIKMQEKSMWLSSEQAADKREGSHLANNYMCCIGLNFWAANKSRQRWVMLRKAVRWTLTGLWWYQCWVLFTKSSVPNRPFRHQHIHHIWDPALPCLQSSLGSWECSEPASEVRTREMHNTELLQPLCFSDVVEQQ